VEIHETYRIYRQSETGWSAVSSDATIVVRVEAWFSQPCEQSTEVVEERLATGGDGPRDDLGEFGVFGVDDAYAVSAATRLVDDVRVEQVL
jgi:hypothetical protein